MDVVSARVAAQQQAGLSIGWRTALRLSLASGFMVSFLVGCATPSASEPRGKWRPLNHFTSVPQAIPLRAGYIYQALPVDGTLKNMLTRWAKDAGVSLDYQHPNDYTLHNQVAEVRANNLTEGAQAMSAAYAAQGLRIAVEGGRLVVTSIDSGSNGAAESTNSN